MVMLSSRAPISGSERSRFALRIKFRVRIDLARLHYTSLTERSSVQVLQPAVKPRYRKLTVRPSICLASIVDSVNSRAVGCIQIKEHTPLADSQAVEPLPISQSLYIAFADFTEACQRKPPVPRQYSKPEFPQHVLVGDAGRWIGAGAIDSREHFRIDGTFAVQEKFEISHRSHQFGLG
jgi:hypothetical protein